LSDSQITSKTKASNGEGYAAMLPTMPHDQGQGIPGKSQKPAKRRACWMKSGLPRPTGIWVIRWFG